jgi:transcriptional regulator with XRE-family HTH domain
MREDHREPTDERFGMNLRTLREQAGMSQTDLAAAMTERGFSWHQQTVGRLEAARQSVRLGEAEALTEILRTSLDRFTWGSAEANETQFTYAAGTRVRMQYEVVADAIRDHRAFTAAAERLLARPPATDSPRVKAAREDVAMRREEYSPDNAIAEGVRRYEYPNGEEAEGDDTQGES